MSRECKRWWAEHLVAGSCWHVSCPRVLRALCCTGVVGGGAGGAGLAGSVCGAEAGGFGEDEAGTSLTAEGSSVVFVSPADGSQEDEGGGCFRLVAAKVPCSCCSRALYLPALNRLESRA